MQNGGASDVEEITVQLAGLQITITARPLAGGATGYLTGSAAGGVRSGPAEPSTEPRYVLDHDPVGRALCTRALAAQGPAELAALPVRFLDYLLTRLRSSHITWSPQARLGRAFKAGVVGRYRLEGHVFPDQTGASDSTPFRNSCYICLRCPQYLEGFWTPDYSKYIDLVKNSLGEFYSEGISHGFATQAEIEAYLVGAGRPWPPRLP